VRGEGVWLIDHRGRAYLDCFNNVCHLGHAHPRVVEAIARQASSSTPIRATCMTTSSPMPSG
jgi:4-aminobutyrate aminotransferase-like enzyme